MDTTKFKGQKAISYARASMGKGKGQEDSTDRQKDRAVQYCEKLEMELDLTYSIIDEGVSAFKPVTYIDELGQTRQKAKNLLDGELADFVEIVRAGGFPNGINLVVEKLDRVYRDKPRRALMHFLNLLEMNVTIHSLMDNHIYEPESENDQMDLLTSVVALCASHYYSKDTGNRIKGSYDRRIEKMQTIDNYYQPTGRVSDWIEKIKTDDGLNVLPFVSEKNKEIIKSIFADYLDGLSTRVIANKLNKEGIRSFRNRLWDETRISYVLKSRSVIGYYSPRKGIEIMYPSIQVVSDAVFKEVQDMLQMSKKAGRKSLDGNIFENLIKCGYCLSEYRRNFSQINPEIIFLPSTMTYMPNARYNRDYYPTEIRKAYRGFKCKSGRLNLENCSGARNDYWFFTDAFFSFLKELDFSKLINKNKDLDSKILQNKITHYRTQLAELDKKIENAEFLLGNVDNENLKLKYSNEISSIGNEKDFILERIEDERLLIQKKEKEKKDIVANQDEIKKILDEASTDFELDAFNNAFVPLIKKDIERKKALKAGLKPKAKKLEFTKDEEIKFKDFCRLWDLYQICMDTQRASWGKPYDDRIKKNLEAQRKEETDLRKKYFSQEMEKDIQGFHLKKKLNVELKKIIKYIRFYPYGFTNYKPTKPKGDRKEKCSCLDSHREDLRAFANELNGIDHSNLEPSQKNGKWQAKEVMDILGIKSRTTWKRYLKETKPIPSPSDENFKIEDAIKWVNKKRGKDNTNSLLKFENRFFSKFMGFSIEFTDICRKDIIKYVLPYHKNSKMGIAFDYDTNKQTYLFSGSFGGKEIKLTRNDYVHNKYKEEDLFIIAEDPIYKKSVNLMWDKAFQDFDTSKLIQNIENINYYSVGSYKKLKTPDAKYRFIQGMYMAFVQLDAQDVTPERKKVLKALKKHIKQEGGEPAKQLESLEKGTQEDSNTIDSTD